MAKKSSPQETPTKGHQPDVVDRLSELSDDLLLPILTAAELDMVTAVRTTLFNTRWRLFWKSFPSLWKSSPSLRFEAAGIPPARFHRLVENALDHRDPRSPLRLLSLTAAATADVAATTTISTEWARVLDRIHDYGPAHRVPTLRFSAQAQTANRPVYFSARFACLCSAVQNLDLSLLIFDLDELRSIASNFASVTSLRLHRCVIRRSSSSYSSSSPFDSIPYLKKLELADCQFEAAAVTVSGNFLAEIVIVFSDTAPPQPRFKISASCCRFLTCRGIYLDYSVSADLPSLESLELDARLRVDYAYPITAEESSLMFVRVFEKFGNAERVKLSPNSIKALTCVPGLLEEQASPFQRMKLVELYGGIPTIKEFNSVISYLFHDNIRGPALFHRLNAGGDNSRRPVVVRKSDLLSLAPR
ncbi:unnamed protein product [Linum tenue]|uniref:Uncharacterized protein n=1 Tax=Linum tenue TaxID=586396 RepID=A0AAV0JDF4_9ROSI|nr:unnamed protein product [Linum tenue]